MDDLVKRLDGLSNDLANRAMFNSARLVIDAAQAIAALTKERDEARAALATARRDALEAALLAVRNEIKEFADPSYAANQPLGSFSERFACECCEKAIRALQENHNG